MKKIVIAVLSFFVLLSSSSSLLYADSCEEECGEGGNKATCKVCKEKAAKDEIKRIENEIAQKSQNQDEARALAIEYGEKIDKLEAEIEALLPEIDALQIKIEELTISIAENSAKVDAINERVLKRMKNSQNTMHFNPLLDFLLGSTGFSDFLRRTYGLSAITGKEDEDKNVLIDIIEKLNHDKEECDEAKYELESKKKDIEAKRAEADAMKKYYNEQVAVINEEIYALMAQEAEQQMIISSLVYNIEDLLAMPRQTSFIHPVANSRISAGLYDGRGHIGIDYAAKYDTPILAPADGVIISMVNSCSLDTGNHLGNRCGGEPAGKGMAAGGNQSRMIVSVNGAIYGLIFFHMRQYDVHAEGVVTAGTMIGRVGSSGNSTGAHCHIELFYLGNGEAADIPAYLNKGYTVGFNLPYNTSSLCTQKKGAPCRLDGSLYFGKGPVTVGW